MDRCYDYEFISNVIAVRLKVEIHEIQFLADRTNGRAIVTLLRLSVCRRRRRRRL